MFQRWSAFPAASPVRQARLEPHACATRVRVRGLGSDRRWDGECVPPRTMRFAPTAVATEVIAVTTTAGSPSRSISLTSVAPQRVPVPQVAVMMMPSMPLDFISFAMARPMSVPVAMGIPQPTVLKKSSYSRRTRLRFPACASHPPEPSDSGRRWQTGHHSRRERTRISPASVRPSSRMEYCAHLVTRTDSMRSGLPIGTVPPSVPIAIVACFISATGSAGGTRS